MHQPTNMGTERTGRRGGPPGPGGAGLDDVTFSRCMKLSGSPIRQGEFGVETIYITWNNRVIGVVGTTIQLCYCYSVTILLFDDLRRVYYTGLYRSDLTTLLPCRTSYSALIQLSTRAHWSGNSVTELGSTGPVHAVTRTHRATGGGWERAGGAGEQPRARHWRPGSESRARTHVGGARARVTSTRHARLAGRGRGCCPCPRTSSVLASCPHVRPCPARADVRQPG